MANQHINNLVDDLISRGRVQSSMRDQYINLLAGSPELEQEFSSMLMRGSDYTNKTKELANERKAQEARAQAEAERLKAERQKLDQWYGQVQGELNEYERVKREVIPTMARYEQTLKDYEILDRVGTPQTSIAPHVPNPTPTPTPTQTPPAGNFVTKDDAGGYIRDLILLQEKVDNIRAKHYKIYGTPLEDNLARHYLETGEDPEQHWRIKHGVDAKLAEVEAKNREAEYAKMKEQARQEVLKEYAMDPNKVVGGPRPPRGGLTPVMENYSSSRALSHSQNNPQGTAPTSDFVPPEQKPQIQASRERVAKASEFFYKHFEDGGTPTTEEGRRLYARHLGIE